MDLAAIGAAIGTLLAIGFAYRSERSARAAKVSAGVAEELAKADKARAEYIQLLEKQNVFLTKQLEEANTSHSRQVTELTAQITNLQTRVANVETAESICQQERVRLLAENSTLRRANDTLKPS